MPRLEGCSDGDLALDIYLTKKEPDFRAQQSIVQLDIHNTSGSSFH